MKSIRLLPLLPLMALLALALPAHGLEHAHQHEHEHGHDHHAAESHATWQVPADHVRWTPDAALLEGMARIRSALHDLAPHEIGRLGPARVIAHADRIDAAIQYLFANCKLEPEPDAALHHILAALMNGSRALHTDPSDSTPLAEMNAALRHYAELFDDPASAPPH